MWDKSLNRHAGRHCGTVADAQRRGRSMKQNIPTSRVSGSGSERRAGSRRGKRHR